MSSVTVTEFGASGVRQGDVLAGKYRVDQVLGEGGMGIVVAAHHMHLDERVAIKFLLPAAMNNPEAVARFDREARAAVKIKSEHVARVIDVGKLETGAPYMVMEYLDGGDLAAWLQRSGPLPVDMAVEFVLQACEALAEAHTMGIVHRDLKPANLFVIRRPDGALSVKVLDFGISKLTGLSGNGMAMTRTQAVMGSPLYMSPEQMESSKTVDPRADIWALGVVLFELVAGRPPFQGELLTELVLRIVNSPTPQLRVARADAPAGLEAVVQRCLEKDRSRRFADVAELAIALSEFAPPRARISVERVTSIMQSHGSLSGMRSSMPLGISSGGLGLPMASTTPLTPQRVTGDSWGRTGGNLTTPGAKAFLALVSTVVVLVIVGGVLLFMGWRGARDVAKVDPSAPPSGALPAALPPPAAPSVAPASPSSPSSTASASLVDPPAAPIVSPQAAQPAAPPSTPHPGAHVPAAPAPPPHSAAPVAAAPSAAPPPPRPNCDPPYTIDAAGHRQYKPECL